jgi:hypothetical protein
MRCEPGFEPVIEGFADSPGFVNVLTLSHGSRVTWYYGHNAHHETPEHRSRQAQPPEHQATHWTAATANVP